MADVENLKCRCGEPAARKVSSAKRVYYGCPRRQTSLRQQCDFYYQPPVTIAPEQAAASSGSVVQEAHSAGSMLPPPSTPTAESPIKRTHSKVDEDSKTRLPHSQKRPKVLQAVLTASHESTILEPPLTPSQKRTKIIAAVLTGSPCPEFDKPEAPPRRPISIPSPSLSDHLALLDDAGVSDSAAGSQNQVPTEPSQDLRSDILGANLSQQQACSSQTVAVSDNGSGDTCLVNDEEQEFGVTNANESRWIHRTPASVRSTDLAAESRFRDLGPASPSPLPRTKGKQKATNYGDTDMPFGDRTKVFHEPSAEETPPTSQRAQYSAATISTMLAALEGVPGYVSRLEKRNQIKDLRIKHLENEVARLRARQEELENILDMYQ